MSSIKEEGEEEHNEDGDENDDEDDEDDDVDVDDDDYDWTLVAISVRSHSPTVSRTDSVRSVKPYGYYFHQQGMASVINACLEELILLKRILNSLADPTWNNVVVYKSIEERFGGTQYTNFEESEFDHISDKQKCLKDVFFVYNIVKEVLEELLEDNTFSKIHKALDAIANMKEDEQSLLQDHADNLFKIKHLKKKLIDEKKQFLVDIEQRKLDLYNIKNDYEDRLIYGKYKVKYVDAWEESRTSQKLLMLKQAEDGYKKIIKESEFKMELEERVHNEITIYLDTNKDDMMEEIEYWSNYYEEERDRRDLEIYNLKTARDQLIEKLEESKIIYLQHQQEIDEWLEYKEKKRQEEELLQRQIDACTKIQAWWRGIMVRKHLGPYRRKKKGKGKKGKGKDKKKKKKK